ncbi:MAG: hypothetical protein Q7R35_03385 [Elusimicrobiota bacterium]|nr:hypothetical protein [Elusimicrobiota bacterium]
MIKKKESGKILCTGLLEHELKMQMRKSKQGFGTLNICYICKRPEGTKTAFSPLVGGCVGTRKLQIKGVNKKMGSLSFYFPICHECATLFGLKWVQS